MKLFVHEETQNSKAERSIRTKSAVTRHTNPRYRKDLHVKQIVLVDRKQDTESAEGQCGRITQKLHSSVSVQAAFSSIKPVYKECP
jgi:hypothetical protein